MSAELQIGIDPSVWTFDPARYDEVATALEHPAPITIQVTAPMQGALILNPRAAGTVVLTLPISPRGWNPSEADRYGAAAVRPVGHRADPQQSGVPAVRRATRWPCCSGTSRPR